MRQWKIGTISMGILLIVVGVLCIINQIGGYSIVEALLKWWPISLIMLGLEILVMSFVARNSETKIRFDGFSIFIIIIILLFSCGAYFVQDIANGGLTSRIVNFNYNSRYETRENKNFSIASNGVTKLIATNQNGNIVIGKSTSDKIEINANITIRNNDEEYAKSIVESLVVIEGSDLLRVSTSKGIYSSDKYKIQGVTVDYDIKIPNNIEVEVENKFGNIEVANNIGNLKVTNSNGDIDISNIAGSVTLNNKFGFIKVNNVEGDLKTEGSNGDIRISNIKGKASVNSKFGEINVTNVAKKIDIVNSNGEITLRNDSVVNEGISIENKFGKIDVSLPKEQQGNFKCSARFGDIHSNLKLVEAEEKDKSKSLNGIIGDSSTSIFIKNDNGDIALNSK